MLPPVPEEAGALREVLLADVALVRPYASVGQHVLIEVAAADEGLFADDAGVDLGLAMLVLFVPHQLFCA